MRYCRKDSGVTEDTGRNVFNLLEVMNPFEKLTKTVSPFPKNKKQKQTKTQMHLWVYTHKNFAYNFSNDMDHLKPVHRCSKDHRLEVKHFWEERTSSSLLSLRTCDCHFSAWRRDACPSQEEFYYKLQKNQEGASLFRVSVRYPNSTAALRSRDQQMPPDQDWGYICFERALWRQNCP